MGDTIPMKISPSETDTVPAASTNRLQLADLELSVYRAEEQATVWKIWQELEDRLGGSPLACSRIWTETWLKHYEQQIKPWFVVGRSAGVPRAICLLSEASTQKIGPMPVHSLHLGTAGEPHGHSVCVEYNDILVEADYRDDFVCKLGLVVAGETGWDQFQLDGVPCNDGPALPLLSDDGQSTISGVSSLQTSVRVRDSRYFDLEQCRQDGGDILAQLGKSTRANIRRRLRQVEATSVEWADSLEQGLDIFLELVALHQARWEAVGMPGAFASRPFLNFQQDLITQLLPEKRVVLARIRSGATTVGCLYLLVDRNRLLDYVSGFVAFEDFPSPGLISHYLCMEQALERGFDAYDFLVGDKRHKENLGKANAQLQWIVFERPRMKYTLRNCLRNSKQLARRIWKRS